MPINETLKFDVSWGGSVRASANTTLVDKSLPAYSYILVPANPSDTEITQIDIPTYTLTATASAINEGGTITFNLNTTMLDAGTAIPYTISGVSVTDISLNSLTGNFVIDAAGKASLTFDIINDMSTEGNETMTLTLNGKNVSKAVTINDTSGLPTYDLGWYSDASGNTPITQVNEGTTAYLVVKTTFVTNGTVLNVSLSGTNVDASDFTNSSLLGTITINNGKGYLAWTPSNDQKTEGVEIVTAVIKQGTTTLNSKIININDTSVTIEVKTATFTSNYNRYTYKTSKPYGQGDVTAWEYIVAYGLLNRDAFTAVNNRAYVSNLSLSQIGTPGSVTLAIGGVTHTVRWAFSLFDLYEEEGESASGGVDAYLDFPSDVIKSITVRSVDNGGTYTATFVPIGNNGQGFIARNSAITSEWYSHAGPMTLEVLSWTK